MAEEQFIDYVKIFGRSGNGGAGSAHLARTAHNPKAGPDGGDGGKGGSIIARGNRNLWTLLHLRYTKHVFAEHGGNGQKNQCFGKDGDNAYIEVPLGTIIRLVDTDEYVGEVLEDGQERTRQRPLQERHASNTPFRSTGRRRHGRMDIPGT